MPRLPGSRRVQLLAAERRDPRVVRDERRVQVPVAFTSVRVRQVRPPACTTSRSPSLVTLSTRTGRSTGSSCAARSRRTSRAPRRWPAPLPAGGRRSGRSATPCTSSMVSESQRCCQAPPGASLASSTTWSTPGRQVVRRGEPRLAGPDHDRVVRSPHRHNVDAPRAMPAQPSRSAAAAHTSPISEITAAPAMKETARAGGGDHHAGATRATITAAARGTARLR